MAPRRRAESGYVLEVPIDLSMIERDAEGQELKVLALRSDGTSASEIAEVAPGGTGTVRLRFDEAPGSVRVLVGPARATDEELAAANTLGIDVPGRLFEKRETRIAPILIRPYWWDWWLRWCREFVIRGRVVCENGCPVPGAEVCAYDVDWWWWWLSTQQVGCDTTDANGVFEIRFRWCCGWWPWWWWKNRLWQVDAGLADRIRGVLERDPQLQLARAGAQPSLGVFENILASEGVASARPLTSHDATKLESIRSALLQRLPAAPELAALRIWPWWPWQPWWDCTPDIIFRVTQDCDRPGTVIVDETVWQTRWDIPNPLDVVLVANDQACCAPCCTDPPCIEGECIDLDRVCGTSIDQIGGNAGTPGPDGYLFPGAVVPGAAAYNADRPFASTVTVEKANLFTGVDYYEIEVDSGGGFGPLPAGAAMNFSRHWMQPPHPPGQPAWQHGDVGFAFTTMSGHLVAESREHYEATTGLPVDAFWTTNADLVVPLDSTRFADGTYHFRVVGWTDGGGGTLTDPKVLPVCGTELDNDWVLTFDNRLNPDPSHPTSPAHPCGSGTVHLCVTEPDTDIIAVRVNGVAVEPCSTVDPRDGGTLEVDFLAHDPDGHLAVYSMLATYAENLAVNLLDRPSSTLSVLAADYVGPTYGEALGQGAPQPTWRGGRFRLAVDLAEAFPEPCCYQLELRAYKRTVDGCYLGFAHNNLTEYTIGVGVCEPREP